MYKNLEAELSRRRITREELARALGLSISTTSNKLNNKNNAQFSLAQAFEIKKYLKFEKSLDFLFDKSA